MKRKVNTIKKARKKSKEIDEKIEYFLRSVDDDDDDDEGGGVMTPVYQGA